MWNSKSSASRDRSGASFIKTAIHAATGASFAISSPRHAVALASPTSWNSASTDNRGRTISTLSNAIDLLATSKELVPIDAVKGVFSVLGGVLILVRDTMGNNQELANIGVECAQICFILKRGTFGKQEKDVSPSILAAITDLNKTIEDIRDSVGRSARQHPLVGAFHSKSDTGKISAWRQDLARILHIFNTELHVFDSLKLDDVEQRVMEGNLLVKEVDVAIRAVDRKLEQGLEELRELYNIPSSEIEPQAGEHPPPAPELFFGRDPLVVLIANCVRQRKHVALIGPGGIGKTSIARTVIHHKVIREYFGLRCHLLSCADITVSDDSANFVNRIGKVIGAKLSSSNPLSSLRAFVSLLTSPLLLVIDNAETILDTFIGQTQIADIIDELGSSPMISLLLTTRTTVLPNNVLWTRIDVPPLDQDAAREAFFSVYNYEKPSRVVDRLLEEVDRHPLSVNLLAWAAAQNQWSVSKLESRWKHEKTRLLHPGQDVGKMRSLAISIELSINSPLMHQLGDNGRHVLQIIAFLPQGVAENQLAGLFPDVPNIELVVEALRRLSLTHHNNNFITMLAPTRLHIQNTSPHSLPLLAGVRKFYYTNLGKHGRPSPGDDNYDNGLWVASEDDNIERLLDHHFSESGQHPSACAASWYFFHYLHWHKPRKTILEPRVQSLPDSLSKWKARCLLAIGNIAFQMGRYAEASQYLTSARNIALADGNGWLATLCLTSLAGLNRDLGRLADAAVLYQQTVTWYSDEGYDFNETISIMRLGSIARRRGDFYQASKLLTQARDYYEPMRTCNFALTTTHLGFLAFDEGNYAQGRNHFNTAIASFTDLRDVGNLGWCLSAFAAMELMVDNWPKVHELIDRARDVFVKASIVGEAAGCLTEKGRAYCFQGEFDLAKEYLARAKEESVLAASATDEAECAYVSAWVEFYQRAYENATVLFLEARRLYGEIDDIAGAADCARSLGEISFLQKDYKGAEKLFAEAKLIYSESMGLYENKMDNRLEIRINEGWKLFRKGNPGRALPQDTN